MFRAPRRPVNPPRWRLRPWKSLPKPPRRPGGLLRGCTPAPAGQQLPASSRGPGTAGPVPPARCRRVGRARDPYRERLPGRRAGCSGLPPPPAVLPASSSGTSRRRLREPRLPERRSRRLPPAFQAAPDPPLPLPAGSHFRQATAELAEGRRAGNGRTTALGSGAGGWRDARRPRLSGRLPRGRRPRAPPPGSPGSGSCGAAGDCGNGGRGRRRAGRREERPRRPPAPSARLLRGRSPSAGPLEGTSRTLPAGLRLRREIQG